MRLRKLKPGMIVKLRNDVTAMVYKNGRRKILKVLDVKEGIQILSEYVNLKSYRWRMWHKKSARFDIVKVMRADLPYFDSLADLTTVWIEKKTNAVIKRVLLDMGWEQQTSDGQ